MIISGGKSGFINKIRRKFSGIYTRFFLAMAVLMFCGILAVGLVSYSIAYSALTGRISQEKINTLVQTRNTADITLKEIEKVLISQSINPLLLRFSANPFGDEYELLKETVKDLVRVKNTNRHIFSIYVYLPGHGIIVTTEDGFWRLEDFYDTAWLEAVTKEKGGNWSTVRSIRTLSGETPGLISYVTPIPFDEHMDSKRNLLVVNVAEKELHKLVQGHSAAESESAFIIDAEGRIVVHRDKGLLGKKPEDGTEMINRVLSSKSGYFSFQDAREKMLVSHAKSEYTRWSYVNVVPERALIEPISYLRAISILVALVCMLCGLFAARIVSSRIYRPISKTILSARQRVTELGAFIKEGEAKDEMAFLSTAIDEIAEKNKKLKNMIQKNETVLKDGFVLDLLLGSSVDEVQMEYKLNQLNLSFPHDRFYVMVLLVDRHGHLVREYSEKDRALFSFAVKNISEEILNNEVYAILVQTDRDKFAAVLNCDGDADSVLALADKIRETISSILRFTVTAGISQSCSSPIEIGLLYKEALDLAKARIILGGNRSIDSRDIVPGGKESLLLATSREEQILSSIRQGNVAEAFRHIDKIVTLVKKEPGYPSEEIHQFFYSILGISIKAVNENGWSISDIFGDNCNLYRDLVENDTLSDIRNWFYEILIRMSHFITEKKESKNYTLIQSILNYMNANYNKDISLNSMADYVSLSTPYLSKLFKSETGENFLEYLTRLRIEKSKELLLEPDTKITAIAEKVNFGNAQNYIRIFKKYEGMTPGQYREAYIKENLNRKQPDGTGGWDN